MQRTHGHGEVQLILSLHIFSSLIRGDGCATALGRGEAAVTVEGASSRPLGGFLTFVTAVAMILGTVLVLVDI
jgi:hypothetical protein